MGKSKKNTYDCQIIMPKESISSNEILELAKYNLAQASQQLDDKEITLYEAKEITKIAREMIRAALVEIMMNNPINNLKLPNSNGN